MAVYLRERLEHHPGMALNHVDATWLADYACRLDEALRACRAGR